MLGVRYVLGVTPVANGCGGSDVTVWYSKSVAKVEVESSATCRTSLSAGVLFWPLKHAAVEIHYSTNPFAFGCYRTLPQWMHCLQENHSQHWWRRCNERRWWDDGCTLQRGKALPKSSSPKPSHEWMKNMNTEVRSCSTDYRTFDSQLGFSFRRCSHGPYQIIDVRWHLSGRLFISQDKSALKDFLCTIQTGKADVSSWFLWKAFLAWSLKKLHHNLCLPCSANVSSASAGLRSMELPRRNWRQVKLCQVRGQLRFLLS